MEFRNIKNTEYRVSPCGVVINPKGVVINPWKENNSGYLLIRIRVDKKPKCLRLHRVVAEAWLPNPDSLPFVKHKNDNKEDNSVENLEWGSNPDNVQEGYDNGCYQYRQRKHQVRVMYNGEFTIYPSLRNAAEVLGLNRKNLAAILKGKKRNTYEGFEFSYEMPND